MLTKIKRGFTLIAFICIIGVILNQNIFKIKASESNINNEAYSEQSKEFYDYVKELKEKYAAEECIMTDDEIYEKIEEKGDCQRKL